MMTCANCTKEFETLEAFGNHICVEDNKLYSRGYYVSMAKRRLVTTSAEGLVDFLIDAGIIKVRHSRSLEEIYDNTRTFTDFICELNKNNYYIVDGAFKK